jgi:hypothetical protein
MPSLVHRFQQKQAAWQRGRTDCGATSSALRPSSTLYAAAAVGAQLRRTARTAAIDKYTSIHHNIIIQPLESK